MECRMDLNILINDELFQYITAGLLDRRRSGDVARDEEFDT